MTFVIISGDIDVSAGSAVAWASSLLDVLAIKLGVPLWLAVGFVMLQGVLIHATVGTFLGVLLIGPLANGMTLMGIHPYWQEVARGLIVLVAVLVSVWQKPLRNIEPVSEESTPL